MARSNAATASMRHDAMDTPRATARFVSAKTSPAKEMIRRWSIFGFVALSILAITAGAFAYLADSRARNLADRSESLDLLATRIAHEISAKAAAFDANAEAGEIANAYLRDALPSRATANGRGLLVTGADGTIAALAGTDVAASGDRL